MIGGLRVFIVIFVGILFGALPAYSLTVGWPEVRTPQKNNRPTPAANTPSEMKEGKHRRVGAGLENVYDKDGRLLSTQRWGKKRDERGREVDDKTHRITTEYLPKGQQRITDEYGTLRGDTFVVSGRTESQKEGV